MSVHYVSGIAIVHDFKAVRSYEHITNLGNLIEIMYNVCIFASILQIVLFSNLCLIAYLDAECYVFYQWKHKVYLSLKST